MPDTWEKDLSCAIQCTRCKAALRPSDNRILSAYDHTPICMPCKKEEEQREDYEKVSREMIGLCMADTETMWGDPGGYCFHHFYPYKC